MARESRAKLRSVPAAPLRAVLYLRQSAHREESISLEIQESAGREHCARHGYDVVAVEADPGITGRTWKRPAVQRTMAWIEEGRADVIVLWKWSRLSRQRRDWAIAVDLVDVAGGRIESATEPIDVATAAGRFSRGVMAEMAAFESERIGETWQEVHARRVASGRPANGKPRWGYTYDTSRKIHLPDPETGPVLAELYRRYVAGESVYLLVRWLNANGHHTLDGYGVSGNGNRWSDRTLRRVLDSGFAAGLITHRGERLTGAHDALIDADLWEAYQAARVGRRVTRSSERSQYLLSGLVRCICGASMTAGQFGHARTPKYRCKGHETGLHSGYVTATLVEGAVKDWLHEIAHDVDSAASLASRAHARRERTTASTVSKQIATAREQLVHATRSHVTGVIPEAAYLVVRDELEQQIAALEERQRQSAVASRRDTAPKVAASLLADWDILPVEHRRGALRDLISNVQVAPGRPRSVVRVVPLWSGPDPQ
ncbi:recombinase family protein [Pseudactinotalea suaedae]|uniref:recombinase family protein n=1 Tax=Pseudactinotalea suaedae TaxID=1524924 RepID=UPI0012E14F39|nr:recombinase family protein [Pseudactinotalea suaedae]